MEETSTHKYFLSALRYLLPKHFDSQKALALTAGVSRSVINEILKGRRLGRPDTHQKIAKAFDFDLFEFYNKGREIQEGNTAFENNHKFVSPVKRGRPKKTEKLPHDEVIRRFQDKETARKLNMMLVELENKDPEKYKQAEAYVLALYESIKLKKTANE